MTTELSAVGAHAAAAPPNTRFDYKQRRTAAGDEHDATENRLRQALAREAALLRERDELIRKLSAWQEIAASHFATLTLREYQIMDLVLAGHPSKNIAADLGISQRTVENHRASIMQKTGSRSLPALAQLAMVATWLDAWNFGSPGDPSSPRDQPKWHGELPTGGFCAAASTARRGTAWMNDPVGGKS
jgi:DNA-binding CsgD family transcriptional regulator